ncbi:MAG: MmcQ/YjbR family DNA-binding protein [Sandaracinaceae bacterium]|nr:MmcQ/YjbR family DNA-binding protein [Sandaracinaceae bacterium]
MTKTKTKKSAARGHGVAKHLRELGLAKYPGAHLKSPWPGHLDLAVKDKTFAYLSPDGEPFSISCKLPESNAVALMLPNTEPTGYGLGKSGWVSASYAEGEEIPPAEIFEAWIDESYRAQAPKRLVAALDGGAPAQAARPKAAAPTKRAKAPASKKPASKKPASKKPASRHRA